MMTDAVYEDGLAIKDLTSFETSTIIIGEEHLTSEKRLNHRKNHSVMWENGENAIHDSTF